MIQLGQKLQNGLTVYFLVLEPTEIETIKEQGENGQITISLEKLVPGVKLDLVISYTPDALKLEEMLKAATQVTWPELFGYIDRAKRELKPVFRSKEELFTETKVHQLADSKPVKKRRVN